MYKIHAPMRTAIAKTTFLSSESSQCRRPQLSWGVLTASTQDLHSVWDFYSLYQDQSQRSPRHCPVTSLLCYIHNSCLAFQHHCNRTFLHKLLFPRKRRGAPRHARDS